MTLPGYADGRISLHRAPVFAAIGGRVAIGESFTNFLPRLAAVLFADTVDAGVTGLTRWLLDAYAIDAHFIGFALVRNTGAAFFVLAFGAWVFGFALAVTFNKRRSVANALAVSFGAIGWA